MKQTILSIISIAFSVLGYSQTATIQGIVTSQDGEPVPFVNIGIIGTSQGTITDSSGKYELKTSQTGQITLTASHVGLKEQSMSISVQPGEIYTVNFRLTEHSKAINEILIRDTNNHSKKENPSGGLRLKQPIKEIPQNIQVIPAQLIVDQQAYDMLENVSRNVSGVQMIEHWGNFARINMRGFKIPAFRNGMNIDLPWGPLTEDLSLVDRIEFVKGPAGFMLSSGEPGGFYNVVTRKAGPQNLSNRVGVNLGSFNTLRTYVNVGGQINKNKNLYYNLNVMASSRNSHRKYEFNNRYSIAPSVWYRVNDKTDISLEYIHQHSTMSVVGAAYVFSARGFGDADRDISLGEPNIDPTNINEHNVFAVLNHKINKNVSVHAQLAYLHYKQIGSSLWTSGVDSTGNVYRTLGIWDALNTAKLGQVFLNAEFKTGIIRHELLAGADLGSKEYYADWFQSGALGGNVPFNIYNSQHGVPSDSIPEFNREQSIRKRASGAYFANQSQEYAAFYIQDQLGFLKNRLRLSIAGRYTVYKGSSYGSQSQDQVFTPRVGLSGDINSNISVYGLYDQSFIPQTGSDFDGNAFVPVEATVNELGIKSLWFKKRLSATFSYFHITKENVLTADPEHQFYSVQLGQVMSKGMELDIMGQVNSSLSVVFNYANTDVSVTEDTDETRIGSRVAGHSRHIHNLWIDYRFNRSVLKGFGMSLGYQHQIDRSSWSWGAENESVLPDYFRLDGAISWKSDNLNIGLNINNLLNSYLYSGSAYASYYYWQTEPGTNFRLQIGCTF